MTKNLPKIFVQIASYRDPECQWTVKDLFEKAAHPERIFVGICWQVSMPEDSDCFIVPYPRPEQVRVTLVDAKDAKGANWARVEASKLWEGEEFVFFSEPHIRYVQNWDLELMRMLDKCDSEKPILTSIQPVYTKPNNLGTPFVASMSVRCFHPNNSGIALINSHHVPDEVIPDKPFSSPVLVVSCLFASSKILREVLQDPYIYFEGDESSYSARAWTHGWDIYCMNTVISYHLDDRKTRPLHWDDKPKESNQLSLLSAERYRFIFGMQDHVSDDAKKDIQKYGLGKTRTLQEYEDFASVNFKERLILSMDKWIIRRTPESIIHPAPLVIQNWRVKELRDWFVECIRYNTDTQHIVKVCANRGISQTVALAEYQLVKQEMSHINDQN